jgi:hypothetical protein
MGIEPTSRTVNARLSGFEDRGRHQASRHFRNDEYRRLPAVMRRMSNVERRKSIMTTTFDIRRSTSETNRALPATSSRS